MRYRLDISTKKTSSWPIIEAEFIGTHPIPCPAKWNSSSGHFADTASSSFRITFRQFAGPSWASSATHLFCNETREWKWLRPNRGLPPAPDRTQSRRAVEAFEALILDYFREGQGC